MDRLADGGHDRLFALPADLGPRAPGPVQGVPGHREVVSPCVAEGRVLLGGGFGSHQFYAFDARTGDALWQRRTRDDGPTAAVVSEGKSHRKIGTRAYAHKG